MEKAPNISPEELEKYDREAAKLNEEMEKAALERQEREADEKNRAPGKKPNLSDVEGSEHEAD